MKKKLVAMLLFMTLAFTACGEKEEESEIGSSDGPTSVIIAEEDDDAEEVPDMDEETVESENTEVPITLYYPDEMAENVMTKVVKLDKLTAETVWEALQEEGILNVDCEINSFSENGESIELDVNEAFGKQLRSYGTAGEMMMIQCTVNTFIDAFECEKLMITENGNVLESGHQVYDFYMTKAE